MPQGIEKDPIQLIDTLTKVYAIDARLFLSKVPLPRSASKLGIDPNNSHASYFWKSTGSNKRSVPINRTVSSNWNQRVPYERAMKIETETKQILKMKHHLAQGQPLRKQTV